MKTAFEIWTAKLSAFTSSPTTTKPTAHISFITGIVVCFPSKLTQHMIDKKVPTSQAWCCQTIRRLQDVSLSNSIDRGTNQNLVR